jgi:uncharacterized surface protein with fasciclin (FAS1) repeats
MTSSSGYYPYLDLVQTYDRGDLRYVPTKKYMYPDDTISGFLQNSDQKYSIFLYLLKTAKMDCLASQAQFHSTMFVCPDYVLVSRYGEDFFMNLDRNSIVKLMNTHILPRVVHLESFNKQYNTVILQTRDDSSTLTLTNAGNNMFLVNGAGNNGDCKIVEGEIELKNGSIYVIDDLLIPENF